MLESTYRSVFRHAIVSSAATPSPDIKRQFIDSFQYYVSPEDTTETPAERLATATRYKKLKAEGILKAALWISISIGLALVIGNLC